MITTNCTSPHLYVPAVSTVHKAKDKILNVAYKVLKAIQTVLSFPLRIVGSKSVSLAGMIRGQSIKDATRGYQQFSYHSLTQEETKKHLVYASLAAAIHKNNSRWMEPFGYTPMQVGTFNTDLEKSGSVLFNRTTGLKITLYEKGDEVLIAFGALNSQASQFSDNERKKCSLLGNKMKLAAISNLLAGRPALYTNADYHMIELLKDPALQNKKITLCGQCLGGSIASYVALRQHIPAVCLNTFPLGAGLQQKIGTENLQNADKLVTHISSRGDFFSDLPVVVKALDATVNFLGIRTPGNFGKRMRVDSIYTSPSKNHSNILGAMIAKAQPELLIPCQNMISTNHDVAREALKTVVNGLKL